MKVELNARDYKPSNAVKRVVEERAEKFLKFVPDLQKSRYTISTEGNEHVCTIDLHALGRDFHCKGHHEDALGAVDMASRSMEQQLRRAHEKLSDHSRDRGTRTAAALEAQLAPPPVEDGLV